VTITARAIKTGNITAAATSALATDAGGSSATLFLAQGSQGALAVISGTFSATLQFEGRAAGGTWFAVPAFPVTGGAVVTSATAAGNFLLFAGGAIELRVRCSTYSSGTAVVELSNAPVGAPLFVSGPVAVGAAGLASNPFIMAGLDASNLTRVVTVLTPADGIANTNQFLWASAAQMILNGSNSWDRLKAANAAANTTGQGVPANGTLVVDGLPGTGSWQGQRTPSVFTTVSLGAGTAEATIWAPTTGKKFRLMGFILTAGAASTLTFKDNTGGTTIFVCRGTTDQPIVVALGNGKISAAANNVLTVTRGTSATLDGTLFGTEE
jgi:hypothetical protein